MRIKNYNQELINLAQLYKIPMIRLMVTVQIHVSVYMNILDVY